MKTALKLVFVLFAFNGFAQDHIDIFQTYYRLSPSNKSDTVAKVDYSQYGGEAKIPFVLKNKDVIIAGLEFNAHEFKFHGNGTAAEPLSGQRLYESKMILGIKKNWNDKFNTLAFYVPKFNSEGKVFANGHLQNGGLILNSYAKTENLDIKFGAYFNTEEFGPMLVPLVGWNWKINDHWRFKGMIPVSLELTYSRPKSNYGFMFVGKNASFLSYDADLGNTYVDMADNNAWLYSEFNVAKNFYVHFKAGHSIIRKFRTFDEDDKLGLKVGPANIGDDRTKLTPWFKDGFSFETRLIFRLPTN